VRAIDANIALRWLTNDDPHQAELAREVLKSPAFVPLTVLIEIVWVLRRTYRFDRSMLHAAITALIDLETISVAPEPGIRWALARQSAGADLPDMLHLIAARGADSFASFERRLARHAGPDTPIAVEHIR
jgi:predicted nucleic-acid-binding protein